MSLQITEDIYECLKCWFPSYENVNEEGDYIYFGKDQDLKDVAEMMVSDLIDKKYIEKVT